jgi:hypothetical protein
MFNRRKQNRKILAEFKAQREFYKRMCEICIDYSKEYEDIGLLHLAEEFYQTAKDYYAEYRLLTEFEKRVRRIMSGA